MLQYCMSVVEHIPDKDKVGSSILLTDTNKYIMPCQGRRRDSKPQAGRFKSVTRHQIIITTRRNMMKK